MMFMNEWDIDEAKGRAYYARTPQLYRAVCILERLQQWTNAHSDGWAYWPKPCRAAKALMTLIQSVDVYQHSAPPDVTALAVKKACQPIKAFLTKQGVSHAVIIPEEN